ncbi:hypothetical protein [Solibacillus sp. FSL K6-1523]|uniref:hypothetical protein n=1 Tax=Solibacillus sp. FSL K6-1523 TaxID=2921471 RepID=UPI0030F9779A
MGLFNRKKEDDFFEMSTDRLVVMDMEKRTSDVVYIDGVDDLSVTSTGRYKVPRADCEVFTSSEGLIYVLKAETQYVNETMRLAALERSIVLKQLTQYKPEPKDNPNFDLFKWAMVFLLFVAIIVAAF